MRNFIITILTFGIFMSCSKSKKDDNKNLSDLKKVKILATTGMIGSTLENLLDTLAEVNTLMGPGVDPHLYKATQGDLALMQNADIIIYNGLHLEGKMVEILDRMKKRKTCISLEDILSKDDLIEIEGFQGNFDPHIWFDVSLWRKASINLSKVLMDTLPQFKSAIEMNSDKYSTELKILDSMAFSQISSIPKEKRVLVTAHDAFGYFGKAYDIEVNGLQGISTLSEAGIKDISNLVNFLVERQIPAVFIETSVSRKSIDAVIDGCRQRGHDIKLGGNLYSDALGAKEGPAGTYTGMVKTNIQTITESLNK